MEKSLELLVSYIFHGDAYSENFQMIVRNMFLLWKLFVWLLLCLEVDDWGCFVWKWMIGGYSAISVVGIFMKSDPLSISLFEEYMF